MASKKDGDRRKHSPMKNPPTRSPSNRKANDATKSLSRRMFLWAVAFGFVLGLCVSSMYSLISEADAHLRHSTARYDLAVNQLPNIPKCDNSKTETALTQNSKTEQKSQGEHDEGKEARDIQADQPIPQPRHVENADDKSQQQPQNEIASEQNQPSNASNEMHVEEKKESPEASEVETRKEINNTGVPKYDKLQQNQPGNASNEMHVEEKKESPEAPEVETRKEINNTGVPKYDKLNLEYDYDGLGIKDFDPNASAVIVSKIHANDTIPTVIQCFCLLHHAYNNRVNYDIVLFASVPISEEELQPIRDNIWPAKFTLVVDNPGLQEMVDALEPERKADLLNRCNVTSSSELTWLTRCREVMSSHEVRYYYHGKNITSNLLSQHLD